MPFTRVSSRSEYSYPTGAFDVRGFTVRTQGDDEKVGKVDDVLVDDDGAPRYLDVDLGFMKKHVLVPVGHAMADREREEVRIPGMTKEGFEHVPDAVEERALTRDYETRLAGAYSGALGNDRMYAGPEYATGHRPQAVSAPEEERLARVDDLDKVEVADGQPDPRGWPVYTADGELAGRVDHLIGDTASMRVPYLSVDLNTDTKGGRRVLIPTGFVDLDTDDKTVRLNALESSVVRSLPDYTGPLDRNYTERLHTELGKAKLGERWYEHPRYSTRRFYGNRAGRAL